jgi:hypothetical protein
MKLSPFIRPNTGQMNLLSPNTGKLLKIKIPVFEMETI